MGAGLEEFKQRVRASWAAGDFDAVATRNIWDVGPRLVGRAGVEPGMRVLDVGCGSGNVAIPAAKAGGEVVGLDLTPELFEAARRHAADEGVEVDWVEGDAEALPFDDASFERVFSSFGVIFAPRHEVAAAEMVRVLAPGGVIALTSWIPTGVNAEMARIAAARMPAPPPFAQSPVLWGDESHVRRLFEPFGLQLEFDGDAAHFIDDSVDAAVQLMEDSFGPWIVAKAALGDDWPSLRQEYHDLYSRWNEATDGSARITAEYLVVVARKPG
jgi:SAM-dependent methyltransferase